MANIDVLICGSGSAGLCAATWLSRCGVKCKILEQRSGPEKVGRADGVQCRTVEVFESFGLSEELLRDAYHVLEVTFWSSTKEGNLIRTRRAADTPPGLSHQPHIIKNQAQLNGILMDAMRRFNGQEVDYGYSVKSVKIDSAAAADPLAYCVTVSAEKDGKDEVFNAKFVLGCDGAHSTVRKALGFNMIGDTSDSVWGVMDVWPRTDFPDIRKKVVIQTHEGSMLIIPREDGIMVRLYIELPRGTTPKLVTIEDLQATATRIFHPYHFAVAETHWWSAYSIGQRLADFFSKENRVFLTGDACHTHSPKAGQGMNTSLQDGYNIGWKLAAILNGQCGSEILKTYNLEREKVASDLIAFDREFAKLFSAKVTNTNGEISSKFSEAFVTASRYTAGLTATYGDSPITRSSWSMQSLASNIKVGMRLPSAQVVRFSDAKAMQFVRAFPADGRWRILVFGGDIKEEASKEKLELLCKYLTSENGPVMRHASPKADIDSFIEPILLLSGKRVEVEQYQIPDYFSPVTGTLLIRDLHKVFFDDESYNSGHGHAYEFFGVDPKQGAVVVVRPDQYVSLVTNIDNHEKLGDFFNGFAIHGR